MTHETSSSGTETLTGGGHSAYYRGTQLLAALTATVLIALTGWRLVHTAIDPVWDQGALLPFAFRGGHYPAIDAGLSSQLVVGLLNLLKPYDPVSSNTLVRTVAAIAYMLSGALLSWSLTKENTRWWSALFMLLLFTSRFPFLWLSSELFAGTFLMLVLWSVVAGLPFAATAIFIVLFSLAKPDLILSGMLVGVVLALDRESSLRTRLTRVAILASTLLLFLLPGIVQNGPSYLLPGRRTLVSFGQHYAAVVSRHQIASQPEPWTEWKQYFDSSFGDVRNVWEAIRSNPIGYEDFVFLSLSKSLRSMLRANLIPLIPAAIFCWSKLRQRKSKTVVVLLLIGLVPIVLLAFLHVRYQARFYPLALFVICKGMTGLRETRTKLLTAAYLVVLLALQVYQSLPVLSCGYWFPD